MPKSAILRFCPSRETCWGVPSPNPAMRLAPQKYFRNGYPKIFNVPPVFCPKNVRCKVKGGLQTMPKKYNTPHRSRVVKTRLSEDEYADFTARLAPYGISQSEFLRQAIRRTAIRPIIHVSAVNDELLSAVGKLTAEYGRIGGNLNQIARYLNEYGAPYNALSGEVRAAIADLAALKYEVLKKVGDAVGNTQAYQL